MDPAERISIVTDEISRDLDEVRAFLDEHRLRTVEIRCVGDRRAPDLEPGDRRELEAWVRAGRAQVLSVSPGTFKCGSGDTAEIERQLGEVLPRSVELAARLEARFVVTFAFDAPEGGPPDAAAVDALRRAAELCGQADLPLLVENEPGFLAGTAAETERLIGLADHVNLFANWDPLNGNRFSEAELTADLVLLFPRVRHVHVKNGVLRPGDRFATCGPLAGGRIDWPSHLRLLLDLGYEGYLGVETHYEPVREGSAAVLSELRGMLARLREEGSPA